jgi:hypothetical protein
VIKNQNRFPLNIIGFKFIAQTLWCYIHILPLLELFDIDMGYRTSVTFQDFIELVPFFFSDKKIMIKN